MNDKGDEDNHEVSKQIKQAGEKENKLNVDEGPCNVERRDESEEHEDEQQQAQHVLQQHEEEKQQQEEDKDMHIDEINDSEDEELIEIEGEQIQRESNNEIEGNDVSTCESMNRFKKCRTKVKIDYCHSYERNSLTLLGLGLDLGFL